MSFLIQEKNKTKMFVCLSLKQMSVQCQLRRFQNEYMTFFGQKEWKSITKATLTHDFFSISTISTQKEKIKNKRNTSWEQIAVVRHPYHLTLLRSVQLDCLNRLSEAWWQNMCTLSSSTCTRAHLGQCACVCACVCVCAYYLTFCCDTVCLVSLSDFLREIHSPE